MMSPTQTQAPPLIHIDVAGGATSSSYASPSRTMVVAIIDRLASHPGTVRPILTYVHFWAVMQLPPSSNSTLGYRKNNQRVGAPAPALSPAEALLAPLPPAARVVRLLAPYQPPAPHDTLLHRYEVLVFPDSPFTTAAAPPQYLFDVNSRYIPNFDALVSNLPPLASTSFCEQLSSYPPSSR